MVEVQEDIIREEISNEAFIAASGDFLKLPAGAELELTIKLIEKVTKPGDEYNLSKKDFKYVLHTDKGKILTLNAWSLYFAIRDAFLEGKKEYKGATIKLTHPGRGEYTCVIVDAKAIPEKVTE